ncbi:MAG: ATP synthase F1 subunit delta [Bacteroidota bacterium]
MQGTRVAARYAKSFIDLTIQQGVLEQAYADMKFILEVCKSNHDFVVFLKSPVIKTDKKQAVIKEIFSGKLNKVTETYLHLIADKKREIYLVEIAAEFVNQYKENKKILTAVITTANGIDDVIRKQVMDIVKGTGNSEVVLEEKINKDIIGGFIIRVGDKQVDASIARKLNNLRRNFKENPFVKEF